MYHEKCKFISLSLMLVIILILFVSGCATTKQQTQTFNLAQESVAFMTLKVSNQYKPSYQPYVKDMTVLQPNRNKTPWNQDDYIKLRFAVDKPYNQVEEQFNEYLVTVSLPPGSYRIGRFYGLGKRKGMIGGIGAFDISLFSDFELNQGKVVYLGHMDATVRQRSNDDDLMAGPALPVLDQVTTGFLRGTFIIEISDKFSEDVAIFKQKYPSLGDSSVEKSILLPWIRPTSKVIRQYNSLTETTR